MSLRAQHSNAKSAPDATPQARERERLCIVTRAVRPLEDLIRFVVGPDGEVVPDIKCKLPGRGVWVTAARTVLEEAIGRGLFARAFKRQVRVPADLVAQTEQLLQRAAIDALAIAGKAGLVAAGYARTAAALERGQVVALVCASGAISGSGRRLAALAGRRTPPAPVIEFLTTAQLDLALNRSNVVHAALLAGPAIDTFMSRSRRLERYRTGAGHRSNRSGKGAAHQAGSLYGCV